MSEPTLRQRIAWLEESSLESNKSVKKWNHAEKILKSHMWLKYKITLQPMTVEEIEQTRDKIANLLKEYAVFPEAYCKIVQLPRGSHALASVEVKTSNFFVELENAAVLCWAPLNLFGSLEKIPGVRRVQVAQR